LTNEETKLSKDTIEGTVKWSGEHWINYVRRPGETQDSGSVSLYHTKYSSAGEGTVAFVMIPDAGIDAIYTDSAELAEWTIETMIRGRGNQFDRDIPVVEATLTRGGDIRKNPSWNIEANEHTIVSTWNVTDPAVIHWGAAPVGIPNLHIFSLLYFTYDTELAVDGKSVDGKPYPRDIWQNSIGGDRSSCVFALAETTLILGK